MGKLNGYKTYIVGTLMVVYGVLGFVLGQLDSIQAAEIIFLGLGTLGLRHGMAKLA